MNPPPSEYKVSPTWGASNPLLKQLGQVTAVATDSMANVLLFHRADRYWDGATFNPDNRLASRDKPIGKDVIVHLKGSTGETLNQWGKDMLVH